MENTDINLKTYLIYVLLMLFVFTSSVAFGQIKVVQFNAGWNKANDVNWVMSLKDCKTIGYTDIASDSKSAGKYKIAVVPTIIIFKDGEEVARFQADLSFKMVATREEVQETRENRDPIERIRALLLSKKYITEEKIKEIEKKIRNEVSHAAELARDKGMPDKNELYDKRFRS